MSYWGPGLSPSNTAASPRIWSTGWLTITWSLAHSCLVEMTSIHYPWTLWDRASRVVLVVKNLPANAGDIRNVVLIPGLGRASGKGNGHPLNYSCLENPWTEEPGRLQSIGPQRVRHDWSDLAHTQHVNICNSYLFQCSLALKVDLQITSHLSLIHMTMEAKHHFPFYGLGIKICK